MTKIPPVMVGEFDLGFFLPGVPDNAAIMLRYVFTRAARFPENLPDAQFESAVAATAETTLTLKKNGVAIGTLVWAVAGTVPVVTFPDDVDFVAGDSFSVENQAVADATLADVSGTIVATR